MDDNHDEDIIRKHLELHAKRMEQIVQSRFNSVMDQVSKLHSESQAVIQRIFNIEKVIRSMTASNYYLAQDLQFLRNELEAFENYIAESDPKAKTAKPEQFVDTRILSELDKSGFIDALYK